MILDKIVEDKKKRLIEQETKISRQQMIANSRLSGRAAHVFQNALEKPGISIIGEYKNASPSLGRIDSNIDLTKRMAQYQHSVDAVSCLTEEDHFCGSAEDFIKIRNMIELPMLRKDFMISEYQFYEAKAIGADAVLLIAAILDDTQLRDFYQLAKELELDALVEVHDEKELERVLCIDAKIIGINNRNLNDFSISLETTRHLSVLVPKDKILVSESGIVSDDDVRYLKNCGVDAFLIGRALMEAKSPMETADHLRAMS